MRWRRAGWRIAYSRNETQQRNDDVDLLIINSGLRTICAFMCICFELLVRNCVDFVHSLFFFSDDLNDENSLRKAALVYTKNWLFNKNSNENNIKIFNYNNDHSIFATCLFSLFLFFIGSFCLFVSYYSILASTTHRRRSLACALNAKTLQNSIRLVRGFLFCF